MKNLTITPTLATLCSLFCLCTLHAQTPYAVRIVQTADKPESPVFERMIQGVLKEIDKSNRVDILPATSTQGAATHLAEVSAGYKIIDNTLTPKSFNDSLSKITFSWSYGVQGAVDLMITEVETGKIHTFYSVPGKGRSAQNFELSYKDTGWAKGKNQQDETEKSRLVATARRLLANQSAGLYNSGANDLVASLVTQAAYAPNRIFPYRLKVLEATEIDKDEAEKVRIEGGKSFDLSKGDRLIVYTTRSVKSGAKAFEHFDVLGRLKYESDQENNGICDVSKGSEKILKALQSGQALWCREGSTPYTLREKAENVSIAIGSFIVPADVSPKLRESMYRRLRRQILGRQGFTVLEREKLAGLKAERELQKQAEFLDNAAIEQFKAVGAELLLELKFLDPVIDIGREFMTNKAVSASVTAMYAMRLLDVETGEVLGERNGRSSKYFEQAEVSQIENNWHSNPGGMSLERHFFHSTIAGMHYDVVDMINDVFPPRISVAEITDEKKEKADEVLLVGDFNMKTYDKFYVMRKRMVNVDGQELPRYEQIGLVSLRNDEGDGVANAKVKDGGKEIYAAMKAGEALFCIDKPNMLERLNKWGNNRMERYGY